MNKYIHPIQQSHYQRANVSKQPTNNKDPFAKILSNVTEVKVSKHAQQRLIERNIHISNQKWQEIGRKMNEAKVKGITDALVVTDNTTLIVSTKNNTVVTALLKDEIHDQIITNINGAIVMK